MEIRVFDIQINPLGVLDELESLLWTNKYFDVGTVGLLAPMTEQNSRLLSIGNIIVKHDGKANVTDADGCIWRRAAQITYVHITKNEEGQEQIEVQGFALSRWLSKRVVTPQIVLTDTIQNIINTLVTKNCGTEAGNKRRFPQFLFLPQANLEGGMVEYTNDAYANLGEEVKTQAQDGKLGYDILINEREQKYGFYLYKGRDLTAKNNKGNTPCIFSRDFDNVNDQEYTACAENHKNFIYVQGAADEEGGQLVVAVDGEAAEGLELSEVFCDASDMVRKYSVEDTEITIPIEDYMVMLSQRGKSELGNYIKTLSFTSSINTQSNLVYKTDFDLGDQITCLEKKWGIRLDARVTEVAETYQKEMVQVEATFGDSLPTLLDKIKKVR